jgi:hypothetical protein
MRPFPTGKFVTKTEISRVRHDFIAPCKPDVGKYNKVHGGQKRKRTQVDQPDDYAAGPSRPKLPPPTLEARFSNPTSKKARKRRRKLERQAMEADTHFKQQIWRNEMNRMNRFLPNQILPPFSFPPDILPYDVSDPVSPTPPFIDGNQLYPSLRQDSLPSASYLAQPFDNSQPYDTKSNDQPLASTSAWVSSMAMAAENSTQIVVDSWNRPPRPSHTQWPATPELGPTISHHSAVHPLPPKPSAERLSVAHEPPEPPKPSAPAIGMKPDQDPSSKHGLFEFPASTSAGGGSSPYIPNPARTLVIEQLPKSYRNADWINSWCKSACGAHPVHLSVNGQGAKALVEFATSDLARKAWGSPRLGSDFAGLKPFQLKGKPREDLIKVWWYRVDGIGAGAGVGEIEEGEIEGDAAEKEVEVSVKKETKKERKARLAKERLEKQKKQAGCAKTSKEPQPHPQPMPTSVPHRPPPLPTPRPDPLTPAQHKQVDQQANLSSVSQSASHHHQQQSSRARPPPRSELRAQWRKQPEPARQLDKTSYGASQKTSGVSGADGESIASSRSPSPVQLSPSEHEAPPPSTLRTSFDKLPGFMDVDAASIDMDLDSPVTSRHPLPKTLSAPYNSSFPLSAPAPQIAPSTPISSPLIPSPGHDSVISASVSALASSNGTFLVPSVQNNLRPSSSASTHSSTPQGTPPLEPRAMKNAPKAPSYTKRSLLARHRDLEERIAKSKLELGLETPAATSTSVMPVAPSDPPLQNHDEDKEGMEDRLRMLVLQSRRGELKVSTPPTPPTTASSSMLSTSSGAESSDSSNSSTSAVSPASAASDGLAGFSLDELAVSFITETIETYKTSPMPKTVPISSPKFKPPPYVGSTTRLELAAKQKRLEQEIAETKVLMAKLTQARTKQEKDAVLAEMRRRSRCVLSLLLVV